MKRYLGTGAILASLVIVGAVTTYKARLAHASDHDDGDTDLKSRALNLTDHFAFLSTDPASPNTLSLLMYFNPRSLPGTQYYLSTNARYEFHLSKATANTDAATYNDNYVFRFEGGAPDATGAQPITLTVLKDGVVQGSPFTSGKTTVFADSKAGTVQTFSGVEGGVNFKYFVGPRADSFTFDVQRYFQVRKFLADRFFGGAGGNGDPAAALGRLAPNCKGQGLLAGVNLATGAPNGTEDDGDNVNLFNPPDCAPDFTKNYNVTAIALDVPIANLGGATIFDTWSTISVAQ